MTTLHTIHTELNAAISAGDLPGVARTLEASKRAGPDSPLSFDRLFRPAACADQPTLPLHCAVAAGQPAIVAFLLAEGCGLELRDARGATPLINAFRAGQFDVVQQLIDLGADYRATTDAGTRVFDMALASGNTRWVDWLLERDLPFASVNSKGTTSLHFACRSANPALVYRVRAQTGFGFDQASEDGRRPLDCCTDAGVFAAILQRAPDLAPDIAFADGDWSLHDYARRGCLGIVCRLLDGGSALSTRGNFSNSVLHYAVESGNVALVEELLRRGADVEAHNHYRYRPLHWAASAGHLAIAQRLVAHGAQIDAKGELTFIIDETKTPLYMAIDDGHAELARFLLDNGASPNILCSSSNDTAAVAAARLGDADLMRYLLERGASPNGVNLNPDSSHPDFYSFPLARAANAAIVDVLVEFGADVNAVDRNPLGPESALRSHVGNVGKEDLQRELGRAELGAIDALLRHGASLHDGKGEILSAAKCAEVMRLLRAAATSPRKVAPLPAQALAAQEHGGFIRTLANLFSGGRYEDKMDEQQIERQRTGLGVALFEQALHCHDEAKLEMVLELLHEAGTDDVNYATADSYHNNQTILHRILDSFRCYRPDDDYAPVTLLRDCVKVLLDKGAAPDAIETLYGETPFHKAAKMACVAYGHGQDDAVIAILDAFADALGDPNIANDDGACVVDLLEHPELVARLRARGARCGECPAALFAAVNEHRPEALARLIGGAENRFGENGDGHNLLEAWALAPTYDEDWPMAERIVHQLEANGFVINARTDNGNTALILACYAGAIVQAQWLFEHYAWDLNEQDDDGFSALAALVNAEFEGSSERAMTHDDYTARRDALAVRMVQRGARLDLADEDGDTPLSLCPSDELRAALEAA